MELKEWSSIPNKSVLKKLEKSDEKGFHLHLFYFLIPSLPLVIQHVTSMTLTHLARTRPPWLKPNCFVSFSSLSQATHHDLCNQFLLPIITNKRLSIFPGVFKIFLPTFSLYYVLMFFIINRKIIQIIRKIVLLNNIARSQILVSVSRVMSQCEPWPRLSWNRIRSPGVGVKNLFEQDMLFTLNVCLDSNNIEKEIKAEV